MAGHSKWANIRHRKALQDAKKGKQFTKLLREVTSAAKVGGPDPKNNPRLRLALERASSHNIPKENVQRALQRADSLASGEGLEAICYEGLGPGGSGLIVEVLTDNRNRSASNVRSTFTKGGGQQTAPGSVSYLFNKVGEINITSDLNEELQLSLLDIPGTLDLLEASPALRSEGVSWLLLTETTELYEVLGKVFSLAPVKVAESSLVWRPRSWISLNEEQFESFYELLARLEGLEDVQEVYHNVEESGSESEGE